MHPIHQLKAALERFQLSIILGGEHDVTRKMDIPKAIASANQAFGPQGAIFLVVFRLLLGRFDFLFCPLGYRRRQRGLRKVATVGRRKTVILNTRRVPILI